VPDAIGPLSRAAAPGALGRVEPRPPQPKGAEGGFHGLVGGLVDDVNRIQHDASEAIAGLAAGNGENLHEVMLAVSKAELSFKFLMEARNKLVDAYREVMRMQL
jgi:flagellar hook-basal body complex protein FliE